LKILLHLYNTQVCRLNQRMNKTIRYVKMHGETAKRSAISVMENMKKKDVVVRKPGNAAIQKQLLQKVS